MFNSFSLSYFVHWDLFWPVLYFFRIMKQLKIDFKGKKKPFKSLNPPLEWYNIQRLKKEHKISQKNHGIEIDFFDWGILKKLNLNEELKKPRLDAVYFNGKSNYDNWMKKMYWY